MAFSADLQHTIKIDLVNIPTITELCLITVTCFKCHDFGDILY